jgi:hypothetical protein
MIEFPTPYTPLQSKSDNATFFQVRQIYMITHTHM